MDVSAAGSMEVVEHADAGGTHDEQVLRGDVHVVRERRERAAAHTRTRMAIQAELDKLVPSEVSAAIPAEALQREREAVAARGGIVQKTAAKVSTDEHTWELFVHEQCVEMAAEGDGWVNYVDGANIAGFKKVADAMLAYGVV